MGEISSFGVGPQHQSTQEEKDAFFMLVQDAGEVMNTMNFQGNLRTGLWRALAFCRNMNFAKFVLSHQEKAEDDINFNGRKAKPHMWKLTDLMGLNHETTLLLETVAHDDTLMVEQELDFGAD